MRPCSGKCGRPSRFVAEYVGLSSNKMLAAFLIITWLVVVALVSASAGCSPKPTNTRPPTTPESPTPTPTHTPTPTPTLTPQPILLPPVVLEEPEAGSRLTGQSDITLRWSCLHVLQAEEYYRVRVKGESSSLSYCYEKHLPLRDLLPGEYNWSVAIVRSTAQDKYEPVSEESDWYSFEILPPSPVVRRISPTSTFQGASVPVAISGENFTHSLALAIGIPLPATFVNSSTITATIPTVLEVGKYPVIVKDSLGQGDSYASFTVIEPIPLRPSYPPLLLRGIDVIGCNVTFKWDWPRTLAENEWFAFRLGRMHDEPHSVAWVKENTFTYNIGDNAGDYSWQVAVCQGDPSEASCSTPLAISERAFFSYGGCWRAD